MLVVPLVKTFHAIFKEAGVKMVLCVLAEGLISCGLARHGFIWKKKKEIDW